MPADINDQTVFKAVRTFIVSVLPGVEVVQGYDNNVSMPEGGCIVMSLLGQTRLATNIHEYDEATYDITKKAEIQLQIDCYGADAYGNADTLITYLRDDYSVNQFPEQIKPLYCDEAKQLSFTNDSSVYENRWMFVLRLQINPVLSRPNETI